MKDKLSPLGIHIAFPPFALSRVNLKLLFVPTISSVSWIRNLPSFPFVIDFLFQLCPETPYLMDTCALSSFQLVVCSTSRNNQSPAFKGLDSPTSSAASSSISTRASSSVSCSAWLFQISVSLLSSSFSEISSPVPSGSRNILALSFAWKSYSSASVV